MIICHPAISNKAGYTMINKALTVVCTLLGCYVWKSKGSECVLDGCRFINMRG